MKVLIIDNYDSFTYNLYQYIGEILEKSKKDFKIEIYKNDEISFEEIENKKYDRIIISPGPGNPEDKEYFGVCSEVIKKLGLKTPILGVCLGFQGIALAFGGKIKKATESIHGKTSKIKHSQNGLFQNIVQGVEVMRYHSLVVKLDEEGQNNELEITARSEDDNEIMAIKHKKYPICGVQFHPESFVSEAGQEILSNFLELK